MNTSVFWELQREEYIKVLSSPYTKEERMHEFFVKNPNFLPLLWPYQNIVFSKFRLGNQYVVDFAFAREDSPGLQWNFIEIKRPADKKITKAGMPTKGLTYALKQASDSLNWFKKFRLEVKEAFPFVLESSKLGLAEPKSHLIIGRKNDLEYDLYSSFLGNNNFGSVEVMSFDRHLKRFKSPALEDKSIPIKVCSFVKGEIKVISELKIHSIQ
jgi:hypothetical protein